MKPNTKTSLSGTKLTPHCKPKANPTTLSGLTVTGAGIDPQQPLPENPYAETTEYTDPQAYAAPEEYTAYPSSDSKTHALLEALLRIHQQQDFERKKAAKHPESPCTKGVYYLLAFSFLSLFGSHKFYIGKILQGCILCVLGWLFAVPAFFCFLGLKKDMLPGLTIMAGALYALVVFGMNLYDVYCDKSNTTPLTDRQGRILR